MLEHYFLLPTTIDRIRRSWLAEPIERYVAWLTKRKFAESTVDRRVPLLMRFGEFSRRRGARHVRDLPGHVDAFVRQQLRRRLCPCRSAHAKRVFVSDLRRPIEQMFRIVLPKRQSISKLPMANWAPTSSRHYVRSADFGTRRSGSTAIIWLGSRSTSRSTPSVGPTRSPPLPSTAFSSKRATATAHNRCARFAPPCGLFFGICSERGSCAPTSAAR